MAETKVAQEFESEVLSVIRKSQTAVVDAIETWAHTVESIKPDLPDIKMPLADKLPKPEQLVANAYDFAEQLLASQSKFAEDVLKATAPLMTVGKAESKK